MIKIYVHAVLFVADGRRPFDESIKEDIAAFIHTVSAYKGLHCLNLCVMADHVHLVLDIPAGIDVFSYFNTLRHWLQDYVELHTAQLPFAWQDRIWMVSKSPSDLPALEKNFRRQLDYHKYRDISQEWEDLLDLEEIDSRCAIKS